MKTKKTMIKHCHFKLWKFDFFFCLTYNKKVLHPKLKSPPKGRTADILILDDPPPVDLPNWTRGLNDAVNKAFPPKKVH